MAINSGDNVSTSYEGLDYSFDKVSFQAGKAPLSRELNLSQEYQEILTRKSTAHLPSGWLSYRPIYTSSDLGNSFYTQDPDGSKPEVALVNGWPIYVTNTYTPLRHVNKIQFNDNNLRSGSRVDGVFLEVWRAVVSPQSGTDTDISEDSSSKPQPISKVSTLNSIYMHNENIGWSVGENGTILKTVDGGSNWISMDTPVNTNFTKVKFYDLNTGFAVADGGVILKTISGGDYWFSLETPITDDLNDIYIINDQKICVVGDNGTLLLSIDGVNFNAVGQTAGVTENLNTVYFYDTTVGWAAGDDGSLLMTKNGGTIWQKYNMINSALGVVITDDIKSLAFYNLNDGIATTAGGKIYRTSDSGFSWSEISDRIWYNNEYQSISDIFPGRVIDFNQIFIKKEFAIKFTIAVYPSSNTFFKNLIYKISPDNYPNSLVLEYTGVQDGINYLNVLDLDSYANSEELKDAINEITSPYKSSDASLPNDQRTKVRVFEATIDYEPFGVPSDFRPTSGSFSSITPAEISFSVEDKAWIAGSNGVALYSNNSGAKWEITDLNVGVDLKGLFFVNNTKGWYCGTDGYIISYDSTAVQVSQIQDTDLTTKVKGRIYPEGNILSEAEDFLTDDIIDPQVGVETSKRIQIQYRVRIVDGIDPYTYTESGLGQDFVYSLGPNLSTDIAGSYVYENLGEENGDYGLWRTRCRNTYDGYSWAIPMFFVTRRNSAAFDADNNINGSTDFTIGAIRPDGLTYESIVDDDVVDIRRQINIQSYSHLLQKNLENLLSNDLKTSISDKDQQGLQYGSTIMAADQYVGQTDIENLAGGGVSSAAVIVEDQKILDPNIEITTSELTFGPIDIGLYHNDPSYYTAYIQRDGVLTNEPITGTFEGLGTNRVIFHIEDNFTPPGGDLEGVEYVITAHYMDYTREGLSRVPQNPLTVKYQSNPLNPNTSCHYHGISTRLPYKVLEILTENVSGYHDYVDIYSAIPILDNVDDQELYAIVGADERDDPDYRRGLNKYRSQQYRGSLILYHYFVRITSTTNIIEVPKNLNGYSIFGVRQVKNVNGSIYKIGIDYLNNETMRDRDGSDLTNLIIYLDPAFTIPADSTIEIILEAFVTADSVGYPSGSTPLPDIGITVNNTGETQEALRTSFTANFKISSRSVSGMYTGVLYPVDTTEIATTVNVDLTSTTISGLLNGTVLGMSSCETRDDISQWYGWYKSDTDQYYSMVLVASIEGLGTSNVNITFDERKTVITGTGSLLLPLLIKQNTMPSISPTSVASVFYKYTPYQTVGNLPDELKVEIINCSDFIYITNLGTGSSDIIKGEPYAIPAEHIPVANDEVFNDNFFSNVDDMDFANYRIDTGFVKIPAIISQYIGEDLIFSDPNNIGDKLGRSYYQECSKDVIYNCESLTISTPRKVFIPFIARVRSKITRPFLRGEIVLVIMSKTYRARPENKTGFYYDDNVEYKPNYNEEVNTSISIYKLNNKPLVRK